MTGIVLRARGGAYEVETPTGVVEASLRGRIKREERTGERIVVGDRVEVARIDEDTWTIDDVHERATALVRRAPGKAPRPKPIVANIDQVVVVFAATHPAPNLRMLDRFLVLAESSELRALIVVNKIDLLGEEESRRLFDVYERIGYTVLYASVKEGRAIEELKEEICGRTSVLTGPSGVGKSSLLNTVQPGLALRVASVSEAVQKGRHTTVNAQLVPLECGGYVADTPGLRELGLWGIPLDALDECFPEFRTVLGECRFGYGCTHTHEPDCAVLAARDAGEISPSRYDSYLRMREEESAASADA